MPDASAREPIPIKACGTISQPGSYELADNLTTTSNCLVIAADAVTIDLAGFTISGPVPRGFGQPHLTAIATDDNRTGITVRHGSISGFTVGVELSGIGSIVEGLRVFNGVEVGISAIGIVKGNTVVEIGGLPGEGVGIVATGTVTGNYVSGSREVGIDVGQGSTVIGNTVTNNGRGILVSCPSNVTDNTATTSITHANLLLGGEGCNNTNNVAP